jgi:ribosome-associated toxin RatA of RatAB toxin-antitoxin module
MLKGFLPSVTKSHVEKRLVPFPMAHLFRIIQDVNAYQDFLPLCTESRILKHYNANEFEASLSVGMPPVFQETYVSHVAVHPDRWTITANSIRSKLFDKLQSQWKLSPAPLTHSETLVDFQVTLTVSDPLIAGTLDQVLRHVAGRQVQAFAERCSVVPIVVPDDEDEDNRHARDQGTVKV